MIEKLASTNDDCAPKLAAVTSIVAVVALVAWLSFLAHTRALSDNVDSRVPGYFVPETNPMMRCVALGRRRGQTEKAEGLTVVVLGHVGTLDVDLNAAYDAARDAPPGVVGRIVVGLRRSPRTRTSIEYARKKLSGFDAVVCDSYDRDEAWRGLWSAGLVTRTHPFVIFDGAMWIAPDWASWLSSVSTLESTPATTSSQTQTQPSIALAGYSLEIAPHRLETYSSPMTRPDGVLHILPGVAAYAPLGQVWDEFLDWIDTRARDVRDRRPFGDDIDSPDDFTDQATDDELEDWYEPHVPDALSASMRAHSGYARLFARFVRERGLLSLHSGVPLAVAVDPFAKNYARNKANRESAFKDLTLTDGSDDG